MIICGIYKITSPSGKVYIGESKNIHKRWYYYRKLSCKNQKKLYNSFRKYSPENHKFEIIEECSVDNLLERERYWQEHYDVISRERGLNGLLTPTSSKKQKMSDEARELSSKAHKGKTAWNKNKEYLQIKGEKHFFFGKKRPEFSESQKGDKNKMYGKIASNAKKVINNITKQTFSSCREAAKFYNIKYSTLRCQLNGQRVNNSNLTYL